MNIRKNIITALLMGCFAAVLYSCSFNKRQTPPPNYFAAIMDSIVQKYKYSDNSLRFLDSLFNMYPEADLTSRFNFYGYSCAFYQKYKNDNSKALLYADSLLILVHNNHDIKDYERLDALANISKGDILFSTKEYDGAYQYYYLGKLAAEKSLDACTYSEYSYRLGMVMYKRNSYAEAAAYFKQAFVESGACKQAFPDFYRRQEVLSNTALSYKKSGNDDSALLYYNKAIGFILDNEIKYPDKQQFFETALGVVYGNLGQVYASSNYEKAEMLYKKSIAINTLPAHNAGDALITQVHLARLYYNKQNMRQLFNTLQQIKRGLDTIKYEHAATEWAELMWRYYDDKNDIANAYYWLKKYNDFKEAEAADDKKLGETDVTAQMKNLENEYEVSLLKKDNKLSQLYLLVAALLFIMTGIIMLLLLYNRSKSRKNIKALTVLNNKNNRQKEQLQNTLAELENRNKEKDRILGIVAHDLRNPIAAISSLISILTEEHKYNAEQRQIFELMQNACTNSIELISEILEFAVNDRDAASAEPEPVDLNLIAGNCVKMLRFKAAEKNQKLQLNLSDTPEIIKASPAKMWRVLSNIITNAIKFSPSGANIQIATTHFENNVQVSVRDRGIGIPDSIKSKIFDTHTEAKRTGTQGEKPFGLGLSICKQIVESFKGKIWFESAVGKGTVFYISLPKENERVQMN